MLKILIADDSIFMRTWLKKLLFELNDQVFAEASTGKEAIEIYRQFKPDIVTMDITMQDLNGIDALKEIIQFDPDAKVIMCSALGQKSVIIEAIKLGAIDFVVKPNFHNLVDIIKKYNHLLLEL
ncbi:MAG TPA: response regulator [Pseudoneobacillus sp.]|nr:response regulator [Pseudoneobacillus sp.]